MNRVSKLSFVSSVLALFTACSGDVIVSATDRTTDITPQNMEQIVASAIDATFLSSQFLPIFDTLDVSDFSEINCIAGTVDAQSNRQLGDQYRPDDTVRLSYEDCMQPSGRIINGNVSISYNSIIGLNRRFTLQSLDQCVAELSSEFAGNVEVFQNFADGEFYPADLVRFTQTSEGVEFIFQRFAEDGVTLEAAPPIGQQVQDVQAIEIPSAAFPVNNAIIVLNSLVLDVDRSLPQNLRFMPNASAFPSVSIDGVEGDTVYTIRDGEFQLENCQQFERRVTFSSSNLLVEQLGGERVLLSGTLELFEISEDLNSFAGVIEDSSFSVNFDRDINRPVNNPNALRPEFTYSLIDYTASITRNVSGRSVTFSAQGGIESPAVEGRVDVNTNPILSASTDDLIPLSGTLSVLGRELEFVNVTFEGIPVLVGGSTGGDTTGTGRGDIDQLIDTFYQDLLDRNFVLADFDPDEDE